MGQFELQAYRGAADGAVVDRPDITYERFASDSAARAKAGRLAKKINGPVDLARAGGAEWNERYITTANPSEYHAAGYRFERLA